MVTIKSLSRVGIFLLSLIHQGMAVPKPNPQTRSVSIGLPGDFPIPTDLPTGLPVGFPAATSSATVGFPTQPTRKINFLPPVKVPVDPRYANKTPPKVETIIVNPAQLEKDYKDVVGIPSAGGAAVMALLTGRENAEEEDIEERDVLGPDNRVLCTQTNVYPYRAIGRLYITYPDANGKQVAQICTAFLVGPRHVSTASHCIPWFVAGSSIRFQPAYSTGEPYGFAYATKIYGLPFDGDTADCDLRDDAAVIIIDKRLGETLGSLGTGTYSTALDSRKNWITYGYPLDLANAEKPYMQQPIGMVAPPSCGTDGPIFTNADLIAGASGGPLWLPADASGKTIHYGVTSAGSIDRSAHASGRTYLQFVAQARKENP